MQRANELLVDHALFFASRNQDQDAIKDVVATLQKVTTDSARQRRLECAHLKNEAQLACLTGPLH